MGGLLQGLWTHASGSQNRSLASSWSLAPHSTHDMWEVFRATEVLALHRLAGTYDLCTMA